ncbi:FecR family protein [[Pseudomonas] boreopolis]|uniref:FecR family protein n=1 Tax=Xanthomonas boreopolis TaxID=86183 RepID=UPI003D9B3653
MSNAPAQHRAHATHEAAHWHALHRAGELAPEQQAQFMDWLVASPLHLREYLAIQCIAGELGGALRSMDIDLDALLAAPPHAPRDNVVALPLASTPRPAPAAARRPRLARAFALAATLAGVAVLAHGFWPREHVHETGLGAPRAFVLDDGSRIHLAGGSAIAVRMSWLQRRIELRRGQASFEVAPGRRPFEVRAAGLRIEDIGTTFDVALRQRQAQVEVAEGRVKVWDGHAPSAPLLADLRAGQSARIAYRDRATRISEEDPQAMTAWWNGRVVFRDEPLSEVAERFNRLNRTQLRIRDAEAGALRLTGNLRGGDIDSLLAFLRDQPTLDVRRAGDELLIGRRGGAAAAPKRL